MIPTFWDKYFSVPTIQADGVEVPLRSIINFIGCTAVDDEANKRTNVTPGGGGAVKGRAIVTLAGADYTLTSEEAANPIIKIAGSSAGFPDVIFPLPGNESESYTRVLELWASGGNLRLKMSSGFTWTIPGALMGSGALVYATFTPAGVTAFTPGGSVEGALQVLGSTGYVGATNKLRYNATSDAVDWIGTNGDAKPMFAELANLTSVSTQNLITVAMADETMMTIDAIVWGARRTSVTKAGRIKMSKTYRRSGGGAPTLVAADTPASHNTSFGTGDVGTSSNSLVVQFTAADTDARNVFAEASVRVARAT